MDENKIRCGHDLRGRGGTSATRRADKQRSWWVVRGSKSMNFVYARCVHCAAALVERVNYKVLEARLQ